VNWNTFFFVIIPYVALTLVLVVTVYRAITRPFTISSLSSQLLERKQLFWGSIPFHYGILYVLLGHLLALLLPSGLLWWNSVPLRLYLLEFSGIIMGVWALAGLMILFWRRVSIRRIQVVSTPMDYVILLGLVVSAVTGVIVATSYRFGSSWFASIFTPYLWSILIFQPRPDLVAPLPWLIKLHVINFFGLLALLPFSRLIHLITYPLSYLLRPWQIVIWARQLKLRQS
jgi:nitrate reductase gamma subunit